METIGLSKPTTTRAYRVVDAHGVTHNVIANNFAQALEHLLLTEPPRQVTRQPRRDRDVATA